MEFWRAYLPWKETPEFITGKLSGDFLIIKKAEDWHDRACSQFSTPVVSMNVTSSIQLISLYFSFGWFVTFVQRLAFISPCLLISS